MSETDRPTCLVIAGSNGAGKTTFAMKYLPVVGYRNFINVDMISQGLAPLSPEGAMLAAGRLFLGELARRINHRDDFAFETTLSGRGYLKLIRKMKLQGWCVQLVYLWVPSVEFSEGRVRERVRSGGHDIPRETIHRRFGRSLRNLVNDYAPLCDLTICYDNADARPVPVFRQDHRGIEVIDANRYDAFMRCYHD